MSKRYGTVEARFWANVHPEPMSGCWLWIGPVDEFGYARFRVGSKKKRMHRASYEMHFGAVPSGLIVRHKCDVPSCVNPEHLEVGTTLDNIHDMDSRGRRCRGEHAPSAKLTAEDVEAIRRADGTERFIAAQFGVSHSTVGRIRRGQNWTHIG